MCWRLASFLQSRFLFLLCTQLLHVPASTVWSKPIYWAVGLDLWVEASTLLPNLAHKSLTCRLHDLFLPPSVFICWTPRHSGKPKVSRKSGVPCGKEPEIPDDRLETSTPSFLHLSPLGLEREINSTVRGHWDFRVSVLYSDCWVSPYDTGPPVCVRGRDIIWKSMYDNVLTLILRQCWLWINKSINYHVVEWMEEKWCAIRQEGSESGLI